MTRTFSPIPKGVSIGQFRVAATAAFSFCLAACASPKSSPGAASPQSRPVGANLSAAPVPPPPRRSELPETLRVMPAGAAFYAHVNGARLRRSPLVGVYQAIAEKLDEDPVAMARQACAFDPLVALRELSVSGRVVPDTGPAVVAALLLDRPASEAIECLKRLGAKPNQSLDGVDLGGDAIAVAAGRLLVVGDVRGVPLAAERAKSGASSQLPSAVHEALETHDGAALVAVGKLGEALRESPFGWTTLSVSSTPERFALRVDADAMQESSAKSHAEAFAPERLLPVTQRHELPQMKVWAEGAHVIFELAVDGGPTRQAYELGVTSALALAAARRYLARAKSGERAALVARIARDLSAYVERQPPAQRRFPASAPPTPKQSPGEQKRVPPADAWLHPTWKAIGFSVSEAVYYSYEILTARGGKSAVVRATGDLDGDGVLSRYSLKLEIDARGEVHVQTTPEVENELE